MSNETILCSVLSPEEVYCNGKAFWINHDSLEHVGSGTPMFWTYVLVSVVLVLFAGDLLLTSLPLLLTVIVQGSCPGSLWGFSLWTGSA